MTKKCNYIKQAAVRHVTDDSWHSASGHRGKGIMKETDSESLEEVQFTSYFTAPSPFAVAILCVCFLYRGLN
jgi:hypothetical protein